MDRDVVRGRTEGALVRAARSALPGSNLAIFSYLAAWGLLLHLAAERDWFVSPAHAAVTVSALFLLLRPNSLPGLVMFSLSWVAVWAWEAPRAYNHTLLFAVLLAAVPITVLVQAFASDPLAPRSVERRLFPYVRLLVYVLFGFAVLHKLNADFFRPAWSCGVDHIERIVARVPLLPSFELDSIGYLLIVGALVVEVSIPVLLSMRRTRTAGLIVAFAFHYLIGFNSLWSFSAPAVALYVSFLPPGLWKRLRQRISGDKRWGAFFGGLSVGMILIVVIGAVVPAIAHRLGLAAYVVSAPLLMGLLVVDSRHDHQRLEGRIRPWQGVLVGLALLVGMSPYLGLGTRANFAMFSNLQTEGSEWNHLFIPRWVQVFSYQERLIVVQDPDETPFASLIDTSGDHMATARAQEPGRVVEYELARAVREYCSNALGPTPATLIVNGVRHDVADVCGDPELVRGPSFPLDRLLRFRVVESPSVCRQ